MTHIDTNNPVYVEWARNHFSALRDGGTWALPSTGLIFTKHGNSLVLTMLMPHMEGMPVTAEQLEKTQRNLYDQTKLVFANAGISVEAAPGVWVATDRPSGSH